MAASKSARWNSSDYDLILNHASETMPLNSDRFELLRTGQKCLPKHKHKTRLEMRAITRGGNHGLALASAIARAQAGAAAVDKSKQRAEARRLARAGVVKAPAPPPPLFINSLPNLPRRARESWPIYQSEGMIRWTDREVTVLSRRVAHWLSVAPDLAKEPLGNLFASAQEVELPPDRRRNHSILRQGDAKSTGWNLRMLDRGRTLLWTLEKVPFDPLRTTWVDPAAPPPEPVPVAAPPPPDWTASRVVAAAAQEAPGAPAAALPLPTPAGGLVEALLALLALPAQMAKIEQRILGLEQAVARGDENAKRQFGDLEQRIATLLRTGIATVVHDTLEAELGGPVASPAPAPQPRHGILRAEHTPPPTPPHVPPGDPGDTVPADPPEDDDDAEAMRKAAALNDALIRGAELGHHTATLPQHQDKQPKADKPLVDVIGLFPRQQEDVRRAINGHADVRFVDPGHPQQWTHRTENVVIVPRGAGALAAELCRKAGVRPVSANSSSGVIHAIEEMLGLKKDTHA